MTEPHHETVTPDDDPPLPEQLISTIAGLIAAGLVTLPAYQGHPEAAQNTAVEYAVALWHRAQAITAQARS